MNDTETLAILFEALIEQTKAIRDLRIESESLKQVMFQHRPAFIPSFQEEVKKAGTAPKVEQLDGLIERLEEAIKGMKQG